ncbi:MAG: 50S ribosomal protein L4 [Candidatus Verstraetearchaeota archaeon]|nr:50S ribosomal protein L4 [Candidatus Verstraetearchaeota archaeon]
MELSAAKRTAKVIGIDGKVKGEVELPSVFFTELRPDLIRRAVISSQTARIVPRTTFYLAGKRTSAESLGVGLDLARVPRVKGEHNPASGSGALVPNVVGGRVAFPPSLEKKYHERINVKERRFALRSAIAATANPESVLERGHILTTDTELPFVVEDGLKDLKKSSEFREFLKKVSLYYDVLRAKEGIRERSGKGKRRGRRWIKPKSLLIVLDTSEAPIRLASRNFTGIDCVGVSELNVERLAPGGHPGRLTIWTESAIRKLGEVYW